MDLLIPLGYHILLDNLHGIEFLVVLLLDQQDFPKPSPSQYLDGHEIGDGDVPFAVIPVQGRVLLYPLQEVVILDLDSLTVLLYVLLSGCQLGLFVGHYMVFALVLLGPRTNASHFNINIIIIIAMSDHEGQKDPIDTEQHPSP